MRGGPAPPRGARSHRSERSGMSDRSAVRTAVYTRRSTVKLRQILQPWPCCQAAWRSRAKPDKDAGSEVCSARATEDAVWRRLSNARSVVEGLLLHTRAQPQHGLGVHLRDA